jgi:undecaprenyl pyrophosphate phosphatase UppP
MREHPSERNTVSTTFTTPQQSTSESTSTLLRRTAIVAVATAIVNAILAVALAAAVDASADFMPLNPVPVAVASIVGVVLGAILLLVLRRFVRRPRPVATGLVVAGTLLSLGGPLGLLGATTAQQPGVSDGAALALIPLHLVVGLAVVVGLIARRD